MQTFLNKNALYATNQSVFAINILLLHFQKEDTPFVTACPPLSFTHYPIMFDFKMIEDFYAGYTERVAKARKSVARPLTYTEKILYTHLYNNVYPSAPLRRGEDYANFAPNRVAMQDATAQMALLQFMNAGKACVAVPSTVHCDHLIRAHRGAAIDLPEAKQGNKEVYDFLESAASCYGIGFWAPGSGIIHQVVLENYAFPGGMMVGTDSHTPNAGGLGMVAIGVGGADAVDVMTGMEWELKFPKIIGVHLKGALNGWASPKDVILKLAGILTVKGGTNAVLEYFGEGTKSLSCTGKATICNMGAEVGATTSVFPYDERMAAYLEATDRKAVAEMANAVAADLRADDEVSTNPEAYYDRVIEIDLSTLEPHINGPFTPDAACTASQMKQRVAENGYPEKVDVCLIGSCTNSSYEDLARAAKVAREAMQLGLKPKAEIIVNPGSEQIRVTAECDGLLQTLEGAGAVIMTNACGPCIGQWKRITDDNTRRNSIVTTFNRNFAKRADGNPNTHAFIVSPEMAIAIAFAGRLDFNPLTDSIPNKAGEEIKLTLPAGSELPPNGFAPCEMGYKAPVAGSPAPAISPDSERLQVLMPFEAPGDIDALDMQLLIKTQGKCTTDHISMAGPWLRFRGHLDHISDNMLMGAVNAFNGETNKVLNATTDSYDSVSAVARSLKSRGIPTIVVAEDNYGEGSSREHAAMEPRHLGVRVILAKSFARIHETNLKKQGILALTFANPADYDKVRENDRISLAGLKSFAPGKPFTLTIHHSDGSSEAIEALHTYNEQQIAWWRAGSALNAIAESPL